MADNPRGTPLAPTDLTEMLRSVSKKIEEATKPISEWQKRMERTIEEVLAHSDFQRIREVLADAANWLSSVVQAFQNATPPNLHGLEDIRDVVALTYEEGLPLVWVPRHEILQLLTEAPNADSRREILLSHRDEILEDCVAVLDDIRALLNDCVSTLPPMCLEWAKESGEATRALQTGLVGPAQSHAANVIDSIIPHMSWFLADKPKRDHTIKRANEDVDEVDSLALLMNHLALRPLVRAYQRWYPGTDQPPPDQFARHVTVHGVGNPNVFNEYNALLAVMLAVSLTRQLCHEVARYLSSADVAA